MQRRGFMFVLSSPSGAGKTSISRLLLERDKHITLSISATTRAKRSNEEEGVDYYFVDKDKFFTMVKNHEFLEHAEVFGNYYGTPQKKVVESLNSGCDVLFDIDWQGTMQLAKNAREDLVSIFILPPSMKELEKRLRVRAQDSEEVVQERMHKASIEISHWDEYDYILVNEDLAESTAKVEAILRAERLKKKRQPELTEFVEKLLAQ